MKNMICLTLGSFILSFATLAAATPLPDSPAIKRDNVVYISGQGGGTVGVPDNHGAAIAEAFESLSQIARANGGSLDDIVKMDVYLANLPKDFDMLNTVEARYFHSYPARTVVGAVIPKKHTVEINAIMVLPNA
ncbi:hypothetical protein AYO45_01460 [Gammaproteobacteria bacterium SCGC AG-212-F23]|nr:hypothetical protein AYO45_01460 [Gammaproteobacteria bacterium SCGC AG-212-F23]